MKRLLVIAMLVGTVAPVDRVDASTFTLESYAVRAHTSDPGLVLWTRNVLAADYTFDLDAVGDVQTAALFTIGTRERALNRDDLYPYSINVGFDFTAPPPDFGGSAQGITGAAWFGRSFGYVLWDNPLTLAFGNTGLLGITLSHETFGLPGSANVDATFQLLRADTSAPATAVPEPSSLLVLALGAIGVALRRKRAA